MKIDALHKGLEIRYKEHSGFINFVCDQYLTLCLPKYDEPLRNVCILIYPSQWKDIELLTGNRSDNK